MKLHITYIAWGTLALALAAWGLVGYQVSHIYDAAAARGEEIANAEQQSDRAAFGQRLTSLAADTTEERAQLEASVGDDIVAVATLLEDTGARAGVDTTVSTAAPGGVEELPGGKTLQSYGIVVQGSGRFAAVMHMTALYEKLPLLSEVESVELTHVGALWHITIRVRISLAASP
jgi:hypothetical protein